MVDSWSIAELADAAAAALRDGSTPGGTAEEASTANGRVREVPNERAIRWYATRGLLDPPLSRRGRTARYGRRHLLQLVAVKRRQAEGRSLAEIQTELLGATDSALERIARLPTGAPEPEPHGVAATRAAVPESAARFWAARPAPAQPAAATPPQPAEPPEPAAAITGVPLAPGVALLLTSAPRPATESDAAALTAAASDLLRLARERGLAPPPDTPTDPTHKGGPQP